MQNPFICKDCAIPKMTGYCKVIHMKNVGLPFSTVLLSNSQTILNLDRSVTTDVLQPVTLNSFIWQTRLSKKIQLTFETEGCVIRNAAG